MTTAYYDVVVLGSRLPGLLASALLAKGGFRVLVLGQDDPGPTYRALGRTLPRAPFDLVPAHTPVVRKTLTELALHQQVKRRLLTRPVTAQIVLPRQRIDLCAEPEAMDAEIDREFPEVRRPVDDILREIERASDALDRATEAELTWPPETFFERRDFRRATSALPRARSGHETWDPLGELAEDHPFRHVVQTPARFASALDPSQLSGLALARTLSAWRKGSVKLDGGYPWLRKQLIDRLETYSGELRVRERADRINLQAGRVSEVRLASSGECIGCSYVIAACDVAKLLRLVPDRAPFEDVFERIGEPQARYYRYTLNIGIEAGGVPVGMADDAFCVRDVDRARATESMLHIERHAPDEDGVVLLCVQSLISRRALDESPNHLAQMRERVLAAVAETVPFLGRHLVFVDSPHDGRDPLDARGETLVPPEEPWSRGQEFMEAVHGYPVRGALGVCAVPTRTPIERLYLCNDQVVPGLGLEGAWLAAATVARLVARHNRRKAWMRRGLFTKSGT